MTLTHGTNIGINFLVHTDDFNVNLNDSDYMLGFFGDDPTDPIQVDEWNTTTYMVDADENVQLQGRNIKYASSTKAYVGENTTPILLTNIPNYQSTLNLRFKHTSSVRVLIARCRLYDRTLTTADPPTGVNAKIAEFVHPGKVQNLPRVTKGSSSWEDASDGDWIMLSRSPGPRGSTGGTISSYAHSQNDWYLGISLSPEPVGKRSNIGLEFSVEYL